jgi:hypothetical protein
MFSFKRINIELLLAVTLVSILSVPSVARGQENFSTISTVYFDVKYQQANTEQDVRKLVDFLLKERKAIVDRLGFDEKKKLEVRVYESVGKFLSESNLQRPWRVAYYARGVLHVQPLKALMMRNLFEVPLSYELSLAILERVTEKGCPRWLAESFAVHQSRELANLTPPIGAKLAAFSDLNQDIQTHPAPPQRDDVHYVLGQTMMFFVVRYGEAKAFGVFKEFDGSKSVESVFKKSFNEEFSAVEKAWARHIAYKTFSIKNR